MKEEITNTEFEKMSNDLILDFAEKSNPKIWHQMAMEWNWDSSSVFLNWLIDNSKLDKATALIIYWKSAPIYYKQFKDRNDLLNKQSWTVDDFDFVEKIEENYLNDFYKNQNFEFNPKNDDGEDWTSNYSEEKLVREIPKTMHNQLIGEKIERPKDFIEGIPPEVHTKLDAIYENYDIIDN